MDKWDSRFIGMARNVATWSKDPKTCVGAIIVPPDKRQVSWGFNGFPAGIEDTEVRLNMREVKHKLTLHAEHNAILNSPVDITGWTLYVTKAPCSQCALPIIQSGIARVVMPWLREEDDWHNAQKLAVSLMNEAGIEIECYD